MGNMRVLPWVKLAMSVAALVAVVAAAFLVVHSRNDSDDLDEYFLRDAKAMQEMGLPVYWLGTEFSVGDLVFRGPSGVAFGGEVEGGGIYMEYGASLEGNDELLGSVTMMDVTVYGRDAWDRVENDIRNPKIPGEPRPVTHRTVSVKGREADLISLPLDTRPVNQLWLIVDMGDAVVVAVAASGGTLYPGGPDSDPFINDPDLFVQVMQDLRPYPQ